MIHRGQRSHNRITALALATVALAFFIGIVLKYVLTK
jgi:hypothetical protein